MTSIHLWRTNTLMHVRQSKYHQLHKERNYRPHSEGKVMLSLVYVCLFTHTPSAVGMPLAITQKDFLVLISVSKMTEAH